MQFQGIDVAGSLVAALVSCVTALFILFLRSAKSDGADYFKVTLVGAFIWSFSVFISEVFWQNELIATLSARTSFAAPIIVFFGIILFSLAFGNQKKHLWKQLTLTQKIFLSAIGVASAFFILVSLSSNLILNTVINHISAFGPFREAYGAFIVILITSSAFYFWIAWRRLRFGRDKNQFRLIIWGFIFSTIFGFITNFVIPLLNMGEYRALGPLGVTVYLATTTYALVAYHLFDIRVFISKAILYSGLLALVMSVFGMTTVIVTTLFTGGTSNIGATLVSGSISALVLIFTFDPLRKWLASVTDRWLFKKEYEQQEVVKELGQKLNRVIALDEAMETVMQTVAHVFHIDKAVTYVFQPSERGETAIKRIKQIGYETADRLILDEKDFVVQYMIDHGEVLDFEQLTLEIEREQALLGRNRKPDEYKTQAEFIRAHAIRTAVHKKLKQLATSIAIPLKLDKQLIGLIMASEKQSGERYSEQDLKLMGLIGDQAISSIQKAKLYEGDLMKTEFVSIASHELLTPVSAIEGYLSMILDEKIAGSELSDQTRSYLEKCFSSSKRLSMLIKDLLSVSRIESGKMKFEPQQFDILKSITDTIDQLKIVGNEKDVKLLIDPPKEKLPSAWIDPDRFSQVLVNLISNAIKYNTQGGTVTVSVAVKKREHMLMVSVTDTGIGMTTDAMSHLFEKFYRVDNPSTVGIVGTGLGLYITKSIVERMGGAISVQSKTSKGTTFSFTVPILRAERSMLA